MGEVGATPKADLPLLGCFRQQPSLFKVRSKIERRSCSLLLTVVRQKLAVSFENIVILDETHFRCGHKGSDKGQCILFGAGIGNNGNDRALHGARPAHMPNPGVPLTTHMFLTELNTYISYTGNSSSLGVPNAVTIKL